MERVRFSKRKLYQLSSQGIYDKQKAKKGCRNLAVVLQNDETSTNRLPGCVGVCVCAGYLNHIHRPENIIIVVHCIDLDSIIEQGRLIYSALHLIYRHACLVLEQRSNRMKIRLQHRSSMSYVLLSTPLWSVTVFDLRHFSSV